MTVVGKTLNEYADEVIVLNEKNRIRAVIQEELLDKLGEFKDDIVDYKVVVQNDDLVRICLYLKIDSPNLDMIDIIMYELSERAGSCYKDSSCCIMVYYWEKY